MNIFCGTAEELLNEVRFGVRHIVLVVVFSIVFTSSKTCSALDQFCEGDHDKQQQLGSIILGSKYLGVSLGYLCKYTYSVSELSRMDLPTFHTGVDYPATPKTIVKAAVSGMLYKGTTTTDGYSLVLAPDNNVDGEVSRIIYLHLNKPTESYSKLLNTHVNIGDEIGTVYNDHVHIEVRRNYNGFSAVGRKKSCNGDCVKLAQSAALTICPGKLIGTDSIKYDKTDLNNANTFGSEVVSPKEKKSIMAFLLSEQFTAPKKKNDFEVYGINIIGNYASAFRELKGGETDFCILQRAGSTWKMLDCGSGVLYEPDEWIKKGVPKKLFDSKFRSQ
jgi:hypothetical protein